MSNILKTLAAGSVSGDYQIERSLRFNSADSAYLSRTPASAGNRKTFTFSNWVKRSQIGTSSNTILSVGTNSSDDVNYIFRDDNRIDLLCRVSSSIVIRFITTAVYRDPSAWYHILVAIDTTQATESNRVKIYVNGTQVTAFDTAIYPSQNQDLQWNNNVVNHIGVTNNQFGFAAYLNGYLTDIHFVDGQALTPSSFGETDETTGVWSPIAYAGTYGTNGFHLDFSDNSSTTALGYDAAGSNDWTPNNFSVTAGAGNDSLVDSPTQYGTDTGAGGEVRGNYATWNAISRLAGGTVSGVYVNGNLDFSVSGVEGAVLTTAISTIICPSSGKWYWEVTAVTVATAAASRSAVGIMNVASLDNAFATAATTTGAYNYTADGNKNASPSSTGYASYGASYTDGDVIGVALDMDAGTITFYKNGSSQGTAFTGLSGEYFPAAGYWGSFIANFGQRPFAYTAPSGFKALCTTNLPDPTVVQGGDYFNTVLWTGDATSPRSITGVGFQPDFVWAKARSVGYSHALYDVLRGGGANSELVSNATTAEGGGNNELYGYLSSFDSDGFTSTAGTSGAANNYYFNQSGVTYVAWNWKANGAGVSNTDGSITSTVSANTTAGISIVTFTAPASGAFTIGHGLGVAPSMIITKSRSNTTDWATYHQALGNAGKVNLNTTGAFTAATNSGWNNTSPTSTLFTMGSDWAGSGITYVAYCFAEVEGFSKFGSYTGNGSADGPFVYTGFRPAFVLVKRYDSGSANNWAIFDDARNPYNAVGKELNPNLSNAEYNGDSTNPNDFLSNGFKIRHTGSAMNASGGTYIYAAFAENPFKYALAR